MIGGNNNDDEKDELDIPLPPERSPEFMMNRMVGHVDEKNANGMSAVIAKGMSAMSMDERIPFVSKLLSDRFIQTNNVNLVYRNPDMFAKWAVKELFKELKFPVDRAGQEDFFKLVEQAITPPPSTEAKTKLKTYFATNENSDKVTQILLPFYHEYIEATKKEFTDKMVQEGRNINDPEVQKELQSKLKESDKTFLGHVSFPFVESLVFEFHEQDGFNPQKKAKLSAGFRTLRNEGVMDELMVRLKEANGFYVAPQVSNDTIRDAYNLYNHGKTFFTDDLSKDHRKLMTTVEQTSREYYSIVNKTSTLLPKDSAMQLKMQSLAGSIENVKTELDHKLLRGEKITQEDVKNVHDQFTELMLSAKTLINQKDENGDNLILKAAKEGNTTMVKSLIEMGGDLNSTTTNYTRGIGKAFKDAFSGKAGDFFKNLFTPPPRTPAQLAKFFGHTEIVDSIRESQKPKIDMSLTKKLETSLGGKSKSSDDLKIDLDVKPSVSFSNKAPEVPQTPKGKSEFVQQWENKIAGTLKELDVGSNKPKNVELSVYALKQVQDYLKGHPSLMPGDETFQKVINRVVVLETNNNLTKNTLHMMDDMRSGKIEPPKEKVTGPKEKTEFVAKWEQALDGFISANKGNPVNKYALEEIKNYMKTHPDTDPTKPDGIMKKLADIEKSTQKGTTPEVKQVLASLKNEINEAKKEGPRLR